MTYCVPFDRLRLADVPQVGGKNASLGELTQALGPAGVRVPPGFAVTADAYSALVAQGDVTARLRATFEGLNAEDVADLTRRADEARAIIHHAGLPKPVADAIVRAYRALGGGETIEVAVRSSATAEDLPEASFAGQQETFLNITGEPALLEACLACFASLYTARAVSYRAGLGHDPLAARLSVGVQRMVRADLGAAGVVFTLDPDSGCRDVVLVTGSWGLGESVVAGRAEPDELLVFKPALASGARAVLRRRLGSKAEKVVYARGRSSTRRVRVSARDQDRYCFTDDEALELARWAVRIEAHYSERYDKPTPMDIEWARDGRTGELFVVQARPETVESRRSPGMLDRWTLGAPGEVLLTGQAIGAGIGAGPARVVHDVGELGDFQHGDVLVARMTDPDWVPVMRKAAAIVTDDGGRTCHAAIVSRELGVPCVVGAGTATTALRGGVSVTVSCAEGTEGQIYRGVLPFQRTAVDMRALPRTTTSVQVNLADPGMAFHVGQLPVAGVGLARQEFIIANALGVHPLALVHPDRVDTATRRTIARRARHHTSPTEWFIATLAEGIATIAAAFHPRPVLVRLSDFKSNEYAGLLGGAAFEPKEENPMLGLRGASRYTHPGYADAFALECRAIHRARVEMGLRNIRIMVPFCRTPAEGRRVTDALAVHGLVRGRDGLQVWVMCELPANVTRIAEFAEVFDGFSIGSNDLTQLVLGVDRDSATLAGLFDERDPAVTRTIAAAIRGAHAAGRPIGICGEAPSDFPDFTKMLVAEGIDSVSLSADAVLRVLPVLADAERDRAVAMPAVRVSPASARQAPDAEATPS